MVVTIGAGAIGGLLGGHLSEVVSDTLLVDDWPEHRAAINSAGLQIGGVRGERVYHPRAIALSALRQETAAPLVVFICVKSQDTARVADCLAGVVGPATSVVSVQNGMNDELLAQRFGRERVIAVACEVGGYLEHAGRIVETRRGGAFVIGALDGEESPRVHAIAQLMSACAPVTVTRNIMGVRWSKLIWNCMINPISAITGWGQGEIVLDAALRTLCLDVGSEAVAVATAAGVQLAPLESMGIDPRRFGSRGADRVAVEDSLVDRYADQLGKTTSMSQDIARGRSTEVDFLNGYVVRRGAELDVATPLNERLIDIVHAIERRDVKPAAALLVPVLGDQPTGDDA